MRKLMCFALLLFTIHSHAQDIIVSNLKKMATADVYFSLGSFSLSSAAKHAIDSLIYHDVLAPRRRVGIIGYTDNIGGESSNLDLSKKRAAAVASYLQYMGIDSQYIEQVTGMGEIEREEKAGGYPKDRRVSILPGGFDIPDKVIWTDSGTLIATIKFKYTTTDFLPVSMPLLDTVVNILKRNPRMYVNANGYVCCHQFGCFNCKPEIIQTSGLTETEYRLRQGDSLSKRRAKAVTAYLTNRGIETNRIKFTGYGYRKNKTSADGKPIHGSDRVEIRAVKK